MATRFVENFVHQLLNEIDKGDVSPLGDAFLNSIFEVMK